MEIKESSEFRPEAHEYCSRTEIKKSSEFRPELVTAKNIGDFLLFAAKNSQEIRGAILESLTTPSPNWILRPPKIPNSDLMKAIRVAEVAESFGQHELSSRLWNQLQINVVSNRPPLTTQEIRTFRRVVRSMKEVLGGADITPPLEDELRRLEEFDSLTRLGKTNRRPQRDRRINEQNRHRLAGVALCEQCGSTKPESLTIATTALHHHGIKLEVDSLRKLRGDYETAHKRWLPDAPDAMTSLLHDCLFRLGWWLLWIGKNPDRRANAPDFCKALLAEELRPHWERMLREFSALRQVEVSHPTAPGICPD